ncbi:MAG: preprotein translocase subunit SecG [Saprospiraceae bacterium]
MLSTVAIVIAIICVLLITIILIQNPKGGGVDSTFGGSAANQMFGAARSADIVEKWTWYLAAALFVLCVTATLVVSSGSAGNVELLSR